MSHIYLLLGKLSGDISLADFEYNSKNGFINGMGMHYSVAHVEIGFFFSFKNLFTLCEVQQQSDRNIRFVCFVFE